MTRRLALALIPLLSWGAPNPRVAIETVMGRIVVELYPQKAPLTVANFLKLVDGGAYEGGSFHRTVKMDNQPDKNIKIEVIQAGPGDVKEGKLDAILLERTSKTGLRHLNGTISMARDGPDTAKADFFICIGAQPELDFGGKRNPDGQGFAAFGKVIHGMDLVKKIQQSPAKQQKLDPPVMIVRISRVK